MLDTVRRYIEAGRDALTPKKAEELARAMVRQGQARADQAGQIARELLDWSRKSSERLRDAIRSEVQKQVAKAGVATKEEVDALKRRIRELESQARQGKAATARKAPTVRTPAAATSKSAATTAKSTAAKRSGTRKSQTSGATRVPRGGTATRTPPPGARGG